MKRETTSTTTIEDSMIPQNVFDFQKSNETAEPKNSNNSSNQELHLPTYSFPLDSLFSQVRLETSAFSLEKWEGCITEVQDDTFTATLVDLKANNSDEEAVFFINEISLEERKMIVEGALFYWNIGYEIRNGQRRSVSEIRFRRLPKISKREIDLGKKRAHLLKSMLNILE